MSAVNQVITEKPPLLLSLVVTERCNLDCVYCFVKRKSNRDMPLKIARRTIERHLNSTSSKFDHVQIDFTGGEPLLCFPLIRHLVSYTISKRWRKKFSFSIGTNGTLITPEIRWWANEHRCVTFGLSFDGIEEAHDKNRSASYKAVIANIDFFQKQPEATVKMTIGPDSINKIAASVKHVHELGMKVAANVVFEDAWGDDKTKYLKIFDQQLNDLVEFYIRNPSLDPPYLVNVPLEGLLFPRKKHERFCGSGVSMITVDVEGVEYPCHRFLPMSSSNPNPSPELKFNKINPEKCNNCILLTVCPSCIAYNYECYSDVDHRTTHHCEFIQLQALASAKLQYLKLKQDIHNNPPEHCDKITGARIKRTVESIRLLMKMMNKTFLEKSHL